MQFVTSMPPAFAGSSETDVANKTSATMLPMTGRELAGFAGNILVNICSLHRNDDTRPFGELVALVGCSNPSANSFA